MPGSPEASRTPGPQEDGSAAPKEPGAAPGPSQCPASSESLGEDDFQFVLCEGCRQESTNLKLLTCLHTLCLDCLTENKPMGQCPVCQAPIPQPDGIPDVDNVLFSSLQARLRVYRRISSGGLSCSRCRREAAAMWCSECEEFLCTGCFEDHQWFFKKRSHEARKVEELRAESAHRFLEGTKKSCSLFCSSPGHTEQGHVTSIFCRKCEKPLCCSCALLDTQHSPFYCDIRTEIQRRQDELAALGQELEQRRGGFEASQAALQKEMERLEEAGSTVRELVKQRVERLVRLIRHQEQELLALVEQRQERGRKELEGELRSVDAVLRRMEAGKRLVEKMGLYATEQEVMDMQPFVKDALEELRRQCPAVDGELMLHEDFAECHARLRALTECIEGLQAPLPAAGPAVPQQDTPSEDDSTPTLDLQPQPHSPGGDTPPTLPSPAAQRDEGAEESSASPLSASGDTTSLPKGLQASVAALQKDFGCWARAHLQHTEELLGVATCLLQAQGRLNKHLVSLSRGVHSMARSLSAITSFLGKMLQPGPQDSRSAPTPQDPLDLSCPSLPSDLLDLFCPSTSQQNKADQGPAASPPARPPSPKVPSPELEKEHPSKSKRDCKHTAGLRKRRKK